MSQGKVCLLCLTSGPGVLPALRQHVYGPAYTRTELSLMLSISRSQVFALHPLYLSLDALSDNAPPEVQQDIQTARQELDLPVRARTGIGAVLYQFRSAAAAWAVSFDAQLLNNY